jgi:ribonuclease BN (tRNA processing enzyme)
MESYCFVIEIDNMKIVYTGDITDKNDIEDLIERSDFLICESTHIEVEELLALIGRKKVKSTILAHIPEEVERKKDWINKRAKDFNCENLIFAFDGLNIDIP